MVLLWCCCGAAVVLLRCCCGATLVLLWCCGTANLAAVVLLLLLLLLKINHIEQSMGGNVFKNLSEFRVRFLWTLLEMHYER